MHFFFASLGNHLVFFILKKYKENVKENLRVIGGGSYSEEEENALGSNLYP
jgi:hypothetical protein